MFISEAISEKNSEIMNMYFTLNKKLDNLMDFVDIEWVMPNFSNGLHKIAHEAPLDADRFRDYNALYSFRTKYNTIEGQFKDFKDPLDGINDILDYIGDIDNSLASAKEIAVREENYDYGKFIDEEYALLRRYKKQFITLNDKLGKYIAEGNTYQDYDYRSEAYFNFF